MFFWSILNALFSQILKTTKDKTMQLRQKARENFEKLLGEVKKDQLFASDERHYYARKSQNKRQGNTKCYFW
ncbi:hypothetical protein QPP91_001588 [Campylobacter jejuni]|nr:hypothetical protein [Campylobacter jejuni]EIQ3474048.1 hypothetical protein [Campylobacter jejuni]EJI0827362.1 hypothetical protein [Campylobacter jejuni]EJR4173455.1 hypothetical protein [Campylobacter jejuni]EKD4911704.1 hypothetical protein [Campylobacter jejuni]